MSLCTSGFSIERIFYIIVHYLQLIFFDFYFLFLNVAFVIFLLRYITFNSYSNDYISRPLFPIYIFPFLFSLLHILLFYYSFTFGRELISKTVKKKKKEHKSKFTSLSRFLRMSH